MSTVSLTLDEIFDLAKKTLLANGCDDETASILSDLIRNAERDGSVSHGLFRLPAYVSGLKSGKINGKGKPEIKKISPSVIKVQGNNSLAPVVLNKGLPELTKAAKENGVAVLAINNSHHMAAMWPETENKLQVLMDRMRNKASSYDREVQFGLRVHVIVRETEKEARAYADGLISKLNLDLGTNIRNRSQDSNSLGVARQSQLREEADEKYYVEPNLWTGIGKGRSGCGAAIVGNPDQIISKLNKYMKMGIRSFILSGYPHKEECKIFAKLVLPKLKTISLLQEQNKMPINEPLTPLAAGTRV